MILAAPWALLGLLALPAIWWLHLRLSRLPTRELPSLLFFVEEPGPVLAAARRRRDLELALALLAAACLALAAAGPEAATGTPGRLVRVVVAGGAPAAQGRYDVRVERAIGGIRDALTPPDRLEVVAWPGEDGKPARDGPRPSPSALAGAARAGAPGLAVVVSDVLPAEVPPDVRWVAVGDPNVPNLGIVGADVEPAADGLRVLVTILHHARDSVDLDLVVHAGSPDALGSELARSRVRLGPDEVKSAVLHLRPTDQDLFVRLVGAGSTEAMASRPRVEAVLRRRPLRSGGSFAGLSAGQVEAIRSALRAVGVEPAGGESADLAFAAQDAGTSLVSVGHSFRLGTLAGAETGVRAPAGIDRLVPHALTADLSTAGLDLVYARAPEGPLPAGTLLWREADGRSWPVLVATRGGLDLHLVPDLARGNPPLSSTPFWPLLVENWVRSIRGERGEGDAYRLGLADAGTLRLGREARPFDPDWLLAARADRGPSPRRFRPWLAGLAVATLALLWVVSARRAPKRVPAPPPLAVAG